MAISVLQENGSIATSGAGLTSQSITMTLTAGSSLHVMEMDFSGNTIAVGDGVNTYTLIGSSINNGSIKSRQYVANNVAGGSTTITVSSTAAAGSYLGFWVREIGYTNGYDTSNGILTTTSTGTDSITSGTLTPSQQPGLVSSMVMWVDGSNVSQIQTTVGTGFTDGGNYLALGSDALETESLRYTSTSPIAATYTGTTTGQHLALITALFKEYIPPPPVITAQPVNQTSTVGGTATFSVTATGATSYQWYSSPPQATFPPASPGLYSNAPTTWTLIGGATLSSYTTSALTSGQTGTLFYCAITNANGTTNSQAARVWLAGLGPDGRGLQ